MLYIVSILLNYHCGLSVVPGDGSTKMNVIALIYRNCQSTEGKIFKEAGLKIYISRKHPNSAVQI